jgi:hypothetical protein
MTFTLVAGGRHTRGAVISRLRRENRELKADKRQLAINAYRHEDEIHTALIRGCQDAMRIAQLTSERDELAAAVERMDERHGKEMRGMKVNLTEMARRLELRSAVAQTQELSLDEIRRHCTTPVLPLHESPLANPASPAHVPSWAVKDEAAT